MPGIADKFTQSAQGRLRWPGMTTSLFPRELFAKCESFRGDLGLLGSQIAVHHSPATRAQIGPVLEHAGGNFRNVGDLGAAEAKRVAGAHLLRLGAKGKA